MKIHNTFLNVAIAGCLSLMVLSSCKDSSKNSIYTNVIAQDTLIENVITRGKYLVDITGCNDCHSPKRMGANGPEIIPELTMSGYPSTRPIVNFDSPLIKEGFSVFYPDLTASAGPWGISFAANLTPDETGIGNWTEEQFRIALTQGKYKGQPNGRMLLPPMPWTNFSNMKEADIHAIFAYLKSIEPIENVVPLPFSPDKI